MTEELLDESYKLYKILYHLSWQYAEDQNEAKYYKVSRILDKSLNRYERRWNAYQKTITKRDPSFSTTKVCN